MKNLITIVTSLVLIAIAGVAAWQIYVPLHEDNVSTQAYEGLRELVRVPEPDPAIQPDTSSSPETSPAPSLDPEPVSPLVPQVDFTSLRAVNPEIMAWLTIDGTNIDYPVARHSDNDYYLHHLFNGEWNSSGCLFMDCSNQADVSDQHTIIYGHHMDNGSMFQNLMYYKDQSFYDEHPTARLFTPDGAYTVEFFTGYVTGVDEDAWQLDFALSEEFPEWLGNAKEKSLFESAATPTAGDRIVTLSTCSYEFYNARFVVHGTIKE